MDVDTSANEVETGPSVLSSVGVQHADRPQLSTGGWHSHTGPAKWSWQLGLSLSLYLPHFVMAASRNLTFDRVR